MRKQLLVWAIILFSLSACEEIMEVPDISNQQVQLLAPANGTIVNDSLIRFSWEGVIDAQGYTVQVARPNFESASQLVLDTVVVIDSTFTGTRLSKRLSSANYEWRVNAFNSGFETDFSLSGFEVNTTAN